MELTNEYDRRIRGEQTDHSYQDDEVQTPTDFTFIYLHILTIRTSDC